MALTQISTGGVKNDAVTAGKIPADAVGQSEIADEAVDEARLQISNAGSNGQFLSKQSGNTGGLTWATVSVPDSDKIEEGNTSVEAVDTGSDGHIKISTEGTERVRIASDGQLKFNQTQSKINNNTSDGSDDRYLSINGGGDASQSRGAGITFYGNEVGSNEGRLWIGAGNSGSANGFISFNTGGSERLRLGNAGQLGIGGATYGSSGQVLTSGGSGAAPSWTTISAAPEVTATASGTIPDGSSVIVKSDGTVSVVAAEAATVGSSGDIEDTAFYDRWAAHDPVNNKVLVIFKAGNNHLKAIVGTVSGTSISWGSSVTFYSGQAQQLHLAWHAYRSKFVICYSRSSPDKAYIGTVTISGTTPSISNQVQLATSHQNEHPRIAFDGSGGGVVTYREYINNYLVCRAFTQAADGSISIGSQLTPAGNITSRWMDVAYDSANDKYQFFYMISSNNTRGTVSGSVNNIDSMSFGTAISFNASATNLNNKYMILECVGSGKFLGIFSDGDNSEKPTATMITVSGTTSTFGSTAVLHDGESVAANSHSLSKYEAISDTYVYTFQDYGDNSEFKSVTFKCTTSGVSDIQSEVVLDSSSNNQVFTCYDSTAKALISVYRDGGNSSYGTYIVQKLATTNVDNGNFLGFASAAYTNGQTATIKVVGNTVTKSSLTAGKKYYIQHNGTIGTTAADPSVEAGIALSSTKLLIKG